MDFVFVTKSSTEIAVADANGNVYYKIVSRFPKSKEEAPTTAVERYKAHLPVLRKPLIPKDFNKIPSLSDPYVTGVIEWQSSRSPTRFHHKAWRSKVQGVDGVPADQVMFAEEGYGISNEERRLFIGGDGDTYLWMWEPSYGSSLLNLSKGSKTIARCRNHHLPLDCYYPSQTRRVLTINDPEELSIEVTTIIITFLYMEYSRTLLDVAEQGFKC
ncbi:hypothetical protein DFP72DRAFT_322985 [Ephemerocybe angulata]|uniref:DUF6593 domain-containing protein n=1 Tax=Ephemerocybe angulata TaxID=980116 RepID=A0A8H6IGZ6_9AGAR|nr:hypothetical protein DFP72DRAFT_322985 [Tulosesus angulatus]